MPACRVIFYTRRVRLKVIIRRREITKQIRSFDRHAAYNGRKCVYVNVSSRRSRIGNYNNTPIYPRDVIIFMAISDESIIIIIINELKPRTIYATRAHNDSVKFLFSYFVSSASRTVRHVIQINYRRHNSAYTRVDNETANSRLTSRSDPFAIFLNCFEAS